jgi:hypothetical protein
MEKHGGEGAHLGEEGRHGLRVGLDVALRGHDRHRARLHERADGHEPTGGFAVAGHARTEALEVCEAKAGLRVAERLLDGGDGKVGRLRAGAVALDEDGRKAVVARGDVDRGGAELGELRLAVSEQLGAGVGRAAGDARERGVGGRERGGAGRDGRRVGGLGDADADGAVLARGAGSEGCHCQGRVALKVRAAADRRPRGGGCHRGAGTAAEAAAARTWARDAVAAAARSVARRRREAMAGEVVEGIRGYWGSAPA